MAYPSKIFDSPQTVLALYKRLGTYRAVADHYGCSIPAVRKHLAQGDLLIRAQPDHSDMFPWGDIAREHQNDAPYKLLRFLGRRRKGLPNRPKDERRLNEWLDMMDNYPGGRLVITYDRDNGWGYAWRQPGDRDYMVDRPTERRLAG